MLVCAIQQPESAIGIHMFPPSRTSLPPPTSLSSLCHTANSHWLSVLHVVGYVFQGCSLSSSHPLFPTEDWLLTITADPIHPLPKTLPCVPVAHLPCVFFKKFYWHIVNLQCCVSFWYAGKWISSLIFFFFFGLVIPKCNPHANTVLSYSLRKHLFVSWVVPDSFRLLGLLFFPLWI